jgi:autotransporter-associated beta strand protein
VTKHIRRVLVGGVSALALVAAGLPAAANPPPHAFNLYSGYTNSVTLQYLTPQQGATAPALNVTFRGSTGFQSSTRVTMDTGSTGMVISNDLIDVRGLTPKGSGSIIYTSDNKVHKGIFYDVPVTITGAAGSTVSAGGTVRVLVVDTPGTAMMGIGVDRGGNPQVNPQYPKEKQNAFLTVTEMNGAAATNFRKGYIVGKDSVTIGLTGNVGSDFAMVKLTPNIIHPPNKWNRPQVGVIVGGVNLGVGDFLPDTGIPYMLVTPQAQVQQGSPCSAPSGICAATGTSVQIVLLPQIPGGLSYGFATGVSGSSPLMPEYVNLRPTDTSNPLNAASPTSVNSGVYFYQGFNYLVDYDGGWIGYQSIGGAGITGFVPLLALQSTVQLQSGFLTDMPVYLIGATILDQAGTGTFASSIMGLGSLTLAHGVVDLLAANTYSGGTIVNGGTLRLGPGASLLSGSTLTINGGTFDLNGNNQTLGALSGTGGTLALGSGTLTLDTSIANTLASAITGSGGLVLQGTGSLNLTGISSFTGPTVVQSGTLSVNGSLAGSVFVGSAGTLSGSGSIGGSASVAGTIAPGNSIGTLSIAGNYLQTAGSTYLAEVTSAGQADLVNVGGIATLQGGTVGVTALPGGLFAPSTTYRLVSAAGGLDGTYASVVDPYPFLQSSLSYDANNVYLNLQIGGFANQALNPTQYAVGAALDASVAQATGDFALVLGTLATATAAQGQAAMTALSGNNYAGFSSAMVQGAQLFMNNFASQAGGGAPSGARVAIAEACDVGCDASSAAASSATWGAWGGGLGGLGTIGAGQPVGGVTYNVGGFAAGLDRQISPNVRIGVTAGYTSGTQWVSGFDGKSTSDTVQAGLYGNFVQDKVYADAIVGYAYSYNQMWRNIAIAGLQPRTAQGRTGANQFYGQLETGYRFDLGGAAEAFVTPFARLQAYTGTQNGFTETGAQSLNLTIAQQTTNSLRTVLGAQLGGTMDLGWREKLAVQFRLGWSHEYADTARPVTATFAGAPAAPFTTFGVAPTRDGVVLGLAANTAIADATSLYLRYEGDISGQDSAHAITAGLRMTW